MSLELTFRQWLEQQEEDLSPAIQRNEEEIPWSDWSSWDEHFDLFAYDDMISPDARVLPHRFTPARARGFIRVFDVPSPKGDHAKLSMRHTGRPEDAVNGGVTHVPSDEIQNVARKYPGYSLGKVDVVWIDDQTGMPLKKKEEVYYLFHPSRATKKLMPHKDYRRAILRSAYDISPSFGEEFVDTTFRLPKRGNRLVKITR